MIDPRVYTVNFIPTAEAVAVDFFELIAGAGGALVLLGLDIGQTTEIGDAQDEQLHWLVRRATGAYTSGSGGNTGVARVPINPGDAAATFTAETLNTTGVAAGSGALDVLHRSSYNIRAGLQIWWTPETAPRCGPSSALVVTMNSTPADSVTFVGTAYVGELSP